MKSEVRGEISNLGLLLFHNGLFRSKVHRMTMGRFEIRVEWENLKYRTSPPPQRIFSIKTVPNDRGGVRNQGRLGNSQILDFSSATTDFRPKLHRFIQREVKPGSVGKISATTDFFDQNCADLSKGECETGVCWEYPNEYGTSTRLLRIFDQKCTDLPGRVSNMGPLLRYSGFCSIKTAQIHQGGVKPWYGEKISNSLRLLFFFPREGNL